ncbi:MAG: 3-deoxy-D-manno-octulosonic acid transferase [Bacteroidia bacterium]|nr:3-deoxy-D-manno-octulosonic acid transferase [Bacteroidia bacterium]
MIPIYNLIISSIRLLIRVAGLFNAKALLLVQGQNTLIQKIREAFTDNQSPVIWIHCASLGEFEQGRPVIEALKKSYPSYKILLTFFSPSGYEVRKTYNQADWVFYLPWDTTKNAKEFIESVKPVLAIFVKYEFWFHYSTELKKRNLPLLSISTIFRQDQTFFKPYGNFYRNILTKFSHFFVQNSQSLKLLESIGIHDATLVGDTRFDRVKSIVDQAEEIEIAKRFKENQKTFVVGSCWPEDIKVLAPFINEKSSQLKFVIVPHEISESFISAIEKDIHVSSVRFSQVGENVADVSVLIIDNVGMLSRLYRYGEFAYVGGGFGRGLHNILEPACYGIPIFFGSKNFEKFQEAIDLINRGGAFVVKDFQDLKVQYELVNIPQTFLLACEVTKQYVEENLGATKKILDYCSKFLAKS